MLSKLEQAQERGQANAAIQRTCAMSVSDSAHRPSDPEHVSLPVQKDGLGFPSPARRTPSWPPSPDEDPSLPPFPLEEPGPRLMAPGSLPSPALSLEEEEEDEDGEDAAEPEGLCSEEHPSQFFAEAQRLREQRLLLDEEVSVGGRIYGVHRVILAAVSSLFRGRLLGSGGPQPPFSLDVTPRAWEAVLTFAYEGVLGPAPQGDVLIAAETLGAPRVKAVAQRGRQGAGSAGEDEKQPSQAEELRENLRSIELLYREGIGCDLELEAGGCRLRGGTPVKRTGRRWHLCARLGVFSPWWFWMDCFMPWVDETMVLPSALWRLITLSSMSGGQHLLFQHHALPTQLLFWRASCM
uniref:Kelch like family member 33 n=1 Tax=Sus scrofa TaxID=9823 RepID=A0A8D1QZN9_PIG